uniref:Minor coat protein n=1 Tax=Arracacha latent virus C TaxID=2057938 RepID=A0A3S7H5L8_9CLOS|nr:minor coat protein [Arracacha latent virus C]
MSHNYPEDQNEHWVLSDGGEDEQDLQPRADVTMFAQYYQVLFKDLKDLDLFIRLDGVIEKLTATIYLKVNIPDGSVMYSYKHKTRNPHNIIQTGGGGFTSAYWKIDNPKTSLIRSELFIKIFEEGDYYIMSIMGWRAYGFKKSFLPSSMDIIFSVPINYINLVANETYVSNIIATSDLIPKSTLNKKPHDLQYRGSLLINNSAKLLLTPEVVKVLSASQIVDSKSLEIKVKEKSLFEALPDIKPEDNIAGLGGVVRLYNVCRTTCRPLDRIKVIITAKFPKLDFLRSIVQIWYGLNDGMLELIFERPRNSNMSKHSFMYRKDGKGMYYGDRSQVALWDERPTDFKSVTFEIVETVENNFQLIINGDEVGKFILPMKTRELDIGYEFQLDQSSLIGKDLNKMKSITDYGEIESVLINNVSANLRPLQVTIDKSQLDLKKMKSGEFISLQSVRQLNDLFTQVPEPIVDVVTPIGDVDVEVNPIIKPTIIKVDMDAIPSRLSKNFVVSNHSGLDPKDDKEYFEFIKDHYRKRNFHEDDLERIIFQMGISFCTSKNSICDRSNSLLWKDSKGAMKRIRKSTHSRVLQSLSKSNWNVERSLLRNRSDQILNMLRNKELEWPTRHAFLRGIKPEYAYMACDFFDLKKSNLSEAEHIALNSAMLYTALKHKHKRTIVNVNQIT